MKVGAASHQLVWLNSLDLAETAISLTVPDFSRLNYLLVH
jgi:hypothetical protein